MILMFLFAKIRHNFPQLNANSRWKLANAADNSSAGIMTKSETRANDSRMADAKATRTTSPPKRHVNINADRPEHTEVCVVAIEPLESLRFWFDSVFCLERNDIFGKATL